MVKRITAILTVLAIILASPAVIVSASDLGGVTEVTVGDTVTVTANAQDGGTTGGLTGNSGNSAQQQAIANNNNAWRQVANEAQAIRQHESNTREVQLIEPTVIITHEDIWLPDRQFRDFVLTYDKFPDRGTNAGYGRQNILVDPIIPEYDWDFGILDNSISGLIAHQLGGGSADSDGTGGSFGSGGFGWGPADFPQLWDLLEFEGYDMPPHPELPEWPHPFDWHPTLGPDVITGGEYIIAGLIHGGLRTIYTLHGGELIYTDNPRMMFYLLQLLLNNSAGMDYMNISVITEQVAFETLEQEIHTRNPTGQFRWFIDGNLIGSAFSRHMSWTFTSAGTYNMRAEQEFTVTRADMGRFKQQVYWVWENSPIGRVCIYVSRAETITVNSNFSAPKNEWLETTIKPVHVSTNQVGMLFILGPNGATTSGGQTHVTQRVTG